LPAVVALQSAAAGARPPVVAIRWMNVVPASRSRAARHHQRRPARRGRDRLRWL
jgi:hypothetical protein